MTSPCPTCEQQREIAQKALSDLIDRDVKIQELTLQLFQVSAELEKANAAIKQQKAQQ